MKLFFLRHGIAEDARGGMRDRDRALTDEGRAEVDQIARGLQRLDLRPAIILTSPFTRAAQTAAIVAPVLGCPIETADELQSGCVLDDLMRLLQRHKHDRIMLVGHEPDFSSMAARLIGADERSLILKKAGLISVKLAAQPRAGGGHLAALLTPKMLRLIAPPMQ